MGLYLVSWVKNRQDHGLNAEHDDRTQTNCQGSRVEVRLKCSLGGTWPDHERVSLSMTNTQSSTQGLERRVQTSEVWTCLTLPSTKSPIVVEFFLDKYFGPTKMSIINSALEKNRERLVFHVGYDPDPKHDQEAAVDGAFAWLFDLNYHTRICRFGTTNFYFFWLEESLLLRPPPPFFLGVASQSHALTFWSDIEMSLHSCSPS